MTEIAEFLSSHSCLASTEELLEEARNGRMFIIVDHEDRENEGDLVIPAQMATPEAINFMAKYGRGLICLALTSKRIQQLELTPMAPDNHSRHSTAFTKSIEAREGITTGISTYDRARTIAVAINDANGKEALVSPGHVFPLRAQDGGVLVRAGHTEAAVDIARLSGLNPSGVICEIMKENGEMARLPDLLGFASTHGLKIGTISDLIAYRRRHDNLIKLTAERNVHFKIGGEWRVRIYQDEIEGTEHIALTLGDFKEDEPTLVRVHMLNLIEDIFELGDQKSNLLSKAMLAIAKRKCGALILLHNLHQNDTISRHLCPQDATETTELRNNGVGAQILSYLGIGKMLLLSNSKNKKYVGLEGYGLSVIDTLPLDNNCPNDENPR